MNCLNKKCTITNVDERMLSCWLCHGVIHIKCSGIPVLAAEATVRHDGLHWCCTSCRKIGVEFYHFFQGRKNMFLEIQKDISDLSQRVADYGKLFDDYASLDNIKSPPQSSPKRRKSARTQNKTNTVLSPGPSSSSHINLAEINTPPSTLSANLPQINIMKQSSSLLIADNGPNAHRELRIIPPKKSIFVSRFASETTTEDIEYYIKNNLNTNADIVTYKFSYSQPRSITSFKISVSSEIFDKIIDPCFWPDNTLVREYIYKENQNINNIARLPSRVTNNQKN